MSLWSFYKVEYHFKASSIADMEGAVSLRIWYVRLGYLFGFVVVILHCGCNSLRDTASFTRWRLSQSGWILCAQVALTEAYNDTFLLPMYLLLGNIKGVLALSY